MFKDRTIITSKYLPGNPSDFMRAGLISTAVAHRINTILDSDRIVVLDHGTVKEFDTPANLVKSRGLFYELVREAGLLSQIDNSGSV